MTLTKVLCPRHKEETPSFVIYPNNHGHCFGCGYHAYMGKDAAPKESTTYVEDLATTFSYIESLPKLPYRGLTLPCDERSAFVVWQDNLYYKRRFFEVTGKQPKYVGAAGHGKPLFILPGSPAELIIVEGEINALSIKEALPEWTIISPGGVNDFFRDKNDSFLPGYLSFNRVVLIVDDDGPGVNAAIRLKAKLLSREGSRKIPVILMSTDANELLVKEGKDGLKEALEGHMDVST